MSSSSTTAAVDDDDLRAFASAKKAIEAEPAPPLLTLPPISTVHKLTTAERATILDLLFEPSVPLHTLSVEFLATKTFGSYYDLIASVGVQLTELADSTSTSDTEWLDKILSTHPRLGAPKVDSAQSQQEQAHLQQSSEEEANKLAVLNELYEAKFPGLRYVVFVNGRRREDIMVDMQKRILRADIAEERTEGIKAMCDIAADRARKLIH